MTTLPLLTADPTFTRRRQLFNAAYQAARLSNPQINALIAGVTVSSSASAPASPYTKLWGGTYPFVASAWAPFVRSDGGWVAVNTGSGAFTIRTATNPTAATPDYGQATGNITNNIQVIGRHTFRTDCPSPTFEMRNTSTIFRVIINGQYVNKLTGSALSGADSSTQFVTVSLPAALQGQFNTFSIETQGDGAGSYGTYGNTLGRIYTRPCDTVYAPKRGQRVAVLGCSYTQGPTQFSPIIRGDGWARVFGDFLGVEDLWACGINGAGYAVANNDLSNRYQDILQPNYPPDAVVMDMALALNDTSVVGTLGDTAYTAVVQATLTKIRNGLNANGNPGVPIIVFGGQQGTSTLATQQRVDTDIEAAVAAMVTAGDKRIAIVRNSLATSPWISGTGYNNGSGGSAGAAYGQSGTTATNDGNADAYKLPDKTHLTTIQQGTSGHLYFGQRAAEEFIAAINAMAA